MEPSTSGSFRLFRLAGIDVFLHWSWFFVAAIQIWARPDEYQVPAWKVAEYLTLFAIVLMHEYGHALACRSVGGQADKIVLWPLGGIAYVSPPERPGPVLWSIVAGPLVNFVLAPILLILLAFATLNGWKVDRPDEYKFLGIVTTMNIGLLVLNLLPVYPLDGGQILHALLWFVMGRWRALLVVSIVGGVGAVLMFAGSVVVAAVVGMGAFLLGFIAIFIGMRSLLAFQAAQHMLRLEQLPRRWGCACPACEKSPPRGQFWMCEHCQSKFDTFATRGRCPGCGAWFLETTCPHCHATNHIDGWFKPDVVLEPIILDSPEQGKSPEGGEANGAGKAGPP
jgi:Zn-dependent protease